VIVGVAEDRAEDQVGHAPTLVRQTFRKRASASE
jgi:hypothetical protein